MTLSRYFAWTLIIALWFLLLWVIQYPVRRKDNLWLRIILIVAKVLLGFVVAFEIVATVSNLMTQLAFPLAALYVVLLGDSVGDILTLIFGRKNGPSRTKVQTLLCLACTFIYMFYGTVNMQMVTANRFTVESPKLDREYKFVFASDFHVGSSQSLKTTEETIQKIADENADFVVLGGDVVDIFTTKEEMERTFALLGEIPVPVYFIYGNHDRQTDMLDTYGDKISPQEVEESIRKNGIIILQDEWVGISDRLVLLGREDASNPGRKPLAEIPTSPGTAFLLQIDHTPYETEDIIASKADLQISGHSHAGQLFPLQWVYRLAGYDAYGFFHHGETELYVSSGVSGWSFPFRTEAGCHYEVVTLTP